MQANIFSVKGISMSHVCSYMPYGVSEEEDTADYRIMCSALCNIKTDFYAVFGSSNGQIQVHFINF